MSFLSFLRGVEDPNAPRRVTSVASTKVPRPSGKPISARIFTPAEVALHATESDCYTIVEGRVYDVTKYLRLHPGGMKLLYKNAGGDSTADFLALRHSVKSRTILDHYYVGELASAHQATLSVHPTQPTVTRPVGSMVGSQPFLSVAPSTSGGGSLTPTPSVAHVYPPPRSGALHPSSSHPDRLSAYRDQAQSLAKAAAPALPTIIASSPSAASSSSESSSEPAGGLSIQLHPPAPRAALPPSTPSPPSSLSLQRSPTTEALEQHLASALSPTTPSDESPSSTMNDGSGSEVDSANSPLKMVAPMRAQSDPPAKQARAQVALPQVPRFDEVSMSATANATTAASAPMDTSETHVVQPIVVPQVVSAAAAARFFAGLSGPASVLPSHVAAAPSAAVAAPSLPAGLGPRPFVLLKRVQKTHDVQHLTFEPLFPTTTSSGSASAASSSQSATSVTTAGHPSLSPSHASALDPALWLHVPCGLHVSLGVTLADGTYVKRPYTPIRNVGGTLEFVIKSYPEPYGLLSRHLHALPIAASSSSDGGVVASPSSIDVWGPFGRFDYEHALAAGKHRWVMIAQGTGVAPMYQLLKFHAQEVDQQRAGQPNGYPKHLALHLLACYRTRDDRLLTDELDQVREQAMGRITVQHVITQASTSSSSSDADAESTAFEGARLNASLLDRYLASIPAAVVGASPSASKSSPLFLLCGSDDFHLQVMAMLLASPIGAKSEDDIFCF